MGLLAPDVSVVAVIGFGTMGIGIVQNFAEGGMAVRAVDQTQSALDKGMAQLAASLNTGTEAGLITDPAAVLARVTPCLWADLDAATNGAQLVVETVPEVLTVKQDVFARLDALPGSVLIGSNTSSFTVSQMTGAMTTPERVVGLHYFNPAHLIPAVEVHYGARTSPDAIEAVIAIMTRMGKVPVRVRKELPGFIINRLTGALEREIDFLLDHGVVTPEDLDAAVKASLGFRLACIGPMEAEDFIGLDTAYRVSNTVFKGLSNATEASPDLGEKVARGELGVKSGKGWYDYAGQTTVEVLAKRDRKLMRQLALFRANSSKPKE
jgi:3-hydroxybutyryl-CoA dehydrogenase